MSKKAKTFANPFEALLDASDSDASPRASANEAESSDEEVHNIEKLINSDLNESESSEDEEETEIPEETKSSNIVEHYPELDDELNLDGSFPFENLIADARASIVSKLDPITSIFFSMTSRKYYSPRHPRQIRDYLRYDLALIIGRSGGVRLLNWCFQNRWQVRLDIVLEECVSNTQRNLFKHFKFIKMTKGSELAVPDYVLEFHFATRETRVLLKQISSWLGRSSNKLLYDNFRQMTGIVPDLESICHGAIYSGKLRELTKFVITKEFLAKSTKSWPKLIALAIEGGNVPALEEFLTRAKRVISEETALKNMTAISPVSILPEIFRSKNFSQFVLYLESKNCVSKESTRHAFLSHCLSLGDLKSLLLLDRNGLFLQNLLEKDPSRLSILSEIRKGHYELAAHLAEILPKISDDLQELYQTLYDLTGRSYRYTLAPILKLLRSLFARGMKPPKPRNYRELSFFSLDQPVSFYGSREGFDIVELYLSDPDSSLGDNLVGNLFKYNRDVSRSVELIKSLDKSARPGIGSEAILDILQLPIEDVFDHVKDLLETVDSAFTDFHDDLFSLYAQKKFGRDILVRYLELVESLSFNIQPRSSTHAAVWLKFDDYELLFQYARFEYLFPFPTVYEKLIDSHSIYSSPDEFEKDLVAKIRFLHDEKNIPFLFEDFSGNQSLVNKLLFHSMEVPDSYDMHEAVLSDFVVSRRLRDPTSADGETLLRYFRALHTFGIDPRPSLWQTVVGRCKFPWYEKVWKFLVELKVSFSPRDALGAFYDLSPVDLKRNKAGVRIYKFLEEHNLPHKE